MSARAPESPRGAAALQCSAYIVANIVLSCQEDACGEVGRDIWRTRLLVVVRNDERCLAGLRCLPNGPLKVVPFHSLRYTMVMV